MKVFTRHEGGVSRPWPLLFVRHDFILSLPHKFLRMRALFWRRVLLAPHYAELFKADVRPQAVCVKAV